MEKRLLRTGPEKTTTTTAQQFPTPAAGEFFARPLHYGMNTPTLHITGRNRLDTAALGRQLARETEGDAMRESADQQARVAQVEAVHQRAIRAATARLLAQSGSAVDLHEVENAAGQEVKRMAKTRSERFDRRMQVGNIDSAGLQKGEQIFVAPEFAMSTADGSAAVEINDHEVQHLDGQARQIKDVLIQTGDPEADELLRTPPVAFFEADAMLAAGYANTSPKYLTDYLLPVNRIAAYVDGTDYQGGTVNGQRLMRHAAETGDIATVRYVIAAAQKNKRRLDPSLN